MHEATEILFEKQNTTLTATEQDNPWLQMASVAASGFGRLLKFNKGKWEVGDDILPDGTKCVAHIDQLARGYVCFKDGRVADQRIGKIANGFKPPKREELPDSDQAGWLEKDASGRLRDPWCEQCYLALTRVDTGELFTFVTGSKGGIEAIAKLCGVYGRKLHDGILPIVALQSTSYKHRQYGRIDKPELQIVGWDGEPMATPVQARTDITADSDDEAPF